MSVDKILGLSGIAQWEPNGDCMDLKFWYIGDNGLSVFEALCPHGCKDVKWKENFSDNHVAGAIEWLESNCHLVDERGYYNPEYRGYISCIPPKTSDWIHTSDAVRYQFYKSCNFDSALRGYVNLPKICSSLKPQIESTLTEFIESEQVQSYLSAKAQEMAHWWASKVGSLGSSGDFFADAFHSMIDRPDVNNSDTEKFAVAMYKDIMTEFSDRFVPFYDADYGAGHKLAKVLNSNGLSHLKKAMPWKTYRHFDFSDAPSVFNWLYNR